MLFVKQDPSERQSLEELLEQDRRRKAVALLSDAYDEWGKGDDSVKVIQCLLQSVGDENDILVARVLKTADALATDRATKYLPVVVALSFFIGLVVVALVRTRGAVNSDNCNTTILTNLEIHSIAFSALFFWVIPAVFVGSVIGVSQTEVRIRRILERFHGDLRNDLKELEEERNQLKAFVGNDWDRVFKGGLYSWRPLHWVSESSREPVNTAQSSSSNPALTGSQSPEPAPYPRTPIRETVGNEQSELLMAPSQPSTQAPSRGDRAQQQNCVKKWWIYQKAAPYLIVLIPTLAGTLTSGRVPPEGWNCRVHVQVLTVFIPWVISAQLGLSSITSFPRVMKRKKKSCGYSLGGSTKNGHAYLRSCMLYIKDLAATLVTIIFTLFTILGSLNKCSCWMSDTAGLILPQQPNIDEILRHRLNVDYPAFIFLGIAIELLVVAFCMWFMYSDALRVFVQRDDGESNWKWYWEVVRKMSNWQNRFGRGDRYTTRASTLSPDDSRGADSIGTELSNLRQGQ